MQGPQLARTMWLVNAALLPAIIARAALSTPTIFLSVAAASAAAVLTAALGHQARREPVANALTDGSAILTAWLIALCLPPDIAPWIAALAAVLGVGVGRELYGGLGRNPFNPAMLGYAFVLIAFPAALSIWPVATDGETVVAAVAQPTALTALKLGVASVGPTVAETGFALAALGGGLLLLGRRTISWHAPAGTLAGAALTAVFLFGATPAVLWQQLIPGSVLLAAFFVATDPVTGCATPLARCLFGLGVGAIAIAIRRFGAYPDGMAFAVLLMNTAAPAIDLAVAAVARRRL